MASVLSRDAITMADDEGFVAAFITRGFLPK
jgi:hypothetical protein